MKMHEKYVDIWSMDESLSLNGKKKAKTYHYLTLNKWRKTLANGFRDGEANCEDVFYPIMYAGVNILRTNLLSIFDILCDTKEHADDFFRCHPSAKFIDDNTYLIRSSVGGYGVSARNVAIYEDAWYLIQQKMDELVNKWYGVKKWGDQKVGEKIFDAKKLKYKNWKDNVITSDIYDKIEKEACINVFNDHSVNNLLILIKAKTGKDLNKDKVMSILKSQGTDTVIDEETANMLANYIGADCWNDLIKDTPNYLIANNNIFYLTLFAKNRPIYIKAKNSDKELYIGHCMDVDLETRLCCGQTRNYDDEDMRYYFTDIDFPTIQFKLHQSTQSILKEIKKHKKDYECLKTHVMKKGADSGDGWHDYGDIDNKVSKNNPVILFQGTGWRTKYDGLHVNIDKYKNENALNNIKIYHDRVVIENCYKPEDQHMVYNDNTERRSRYNYFT